MTEHHFFMQRSLQLATLGQYLVAPNPMVGALLVNQGRIIGEGFHRIFGGPHAEVEAINQVINKELIIGSTIYINLEPCAHFGKTPPCAKLLIEHKVATVVIACHDPNPLVSGKGIEMLKSAGINVITGILEKEAMELNKRFINYHINKRPFVTLKWAQTADGFIGRPKNSAFSAKITDPYSDKIVHKLRSTEQAILIGYNTALIDNPSLTVRYWKGKNPIRIIIDKENTLPRHLKIFNDGFQTIVFTYKPSHNNDHVNYIKLNSQYFLIEILEELYKRNIQSLLVEGGSSTLSMFINSSLWDEAHVFTSNEFWGKGTSAPEMKHFAIDFQTQFMKDQYQRFTPSLSL